MKKLAFYRPAIACFLGMMCFALFSSGLSFFVATVSADLGVGRGSFTMYYSLMAIGGALAAPTLGKLAGKHGVRRLLIVSAVWGCVAMMLFSVANALWMFYVVGLACGLMGNACVMLCVNIALQRSYDARTMSAIMGIVMAGSGVGGMILSAVMPGLLEQIGWRNGYRVMGITWLVLLLLVVVVMGKEQAPAQSGAKAAGGEDGLTQAQLLKKPAMYLLILESAVLAASCGILQQYPALLGGMGFDTAAVAAMMSLMTASMAVGKIALGGLYSAAGVRKGGAAAIVVFMAGLLLLILPQAVYPALILSAVGLGIYTTLMPLVTREVLGSSSFAAAWGMVQLGGSLGGFVGNPVWGAVYDATGSYLPALVGFPVALGITLVMHLILTGKKKTA